jgi:DNA-binding NarL/FixJ family response regulator
LLHALCVSRHRFLSDHLGVFFGRYGLSTTCVVGLEEAIAAAEQCTPALVICDYDLLATLSLDEWERHATLSRLPVVAVSMTRRSDEMHPLDVNGIAGFLYLPTLHPEKAQRILGALTASRDVPELSRPSPSRPVSPT